MTSGEQKITCSVCTTILFEPYIKCSDCEHQDLWLCLYCFAQGRETQSHRNSHKYEVIKNDFTVLESGWTAADETQLLDAITQCGLGNWVDIARKVRKSAAECRRHYRRIYIDNSKGRFTELDDLSGDSRLCPIVLKSADVPPRPAEGSSLQHDMSGYVPARGDFTIEHDNFAEIYLANLDFNGDENINARCIAEGNVDKEFKKELKMGVLDIYYRVVKERYRRRQLVRDYGLISFRRHLLYERKYYRTIGAKATNSLRVFARHMPAMELDKIMESYHLESVIRKEIGQLAECRKQGITRLLSASIYKDLKHNRDQDRHSRNLLDDAITLLRKEQWMGKQALLGNIVKGVPSTVPPNAKRETRPLNIVGLPNYDKLSDKEKQFCRAARFSPDMFINYNRLLIAENDKVGHVKLAVARTLLKIDVNKTRRIFDYLADEGRITKDESSAKIKTIL